MLITTTPDITISATIGSPKMVIYGYAPSNSNVFLNSIGVSSYTQADNDGYYLFDAVYTYDFSYPEICVQAVDEKKRTTQPTCIPPLPAEKLIYEVGPIFLSPTISLSQNSVVKSEQAYVEGKTSPNKEVNIYIAKNENLKSFSLVDAVNAYYVPVFQSKSNSNGNFAFSLPTSDYSNYKIFVSSRFGDNLSAKSNTLTFVVTSKIESFLDRLLGFILKNKLLSIIILEILIVIILIFKLLKLTTRGKKDIQKQQMI
ncbi:hypothetical protein A2422_00095 [Candidatus Woesebacteria bacterium RIFOXYC1_FULL_31_51]|uniref:Uncharacterized protein n=1 Tax=Candidatus Woesebacteria bacterium GW2011_GWC2_31_9 TaxID=1618586 RepID=A0A0F9YI47_9BACT|nr:MAG: hypothetical protein UR17_C0001G0468 [Candidatus Woesebacteria bacterium GW2011_GWF1_31_35]KKP23061.1 MAG: hypothetical protein UR11_C0001G0035 [Candidatus Woesebacteria bacterium GW2011_GWC1_30_29]KKP25351.1 MAG: hypothetical protein UR13_C0009G0035 [Candidatus Woesebacteria bacterium GW2011_GWD1_31_12]KKP27303.1 MAG: hypothetical protein UR16_C0004G0035 [Candidatus Woesebacteria bacterium GW2011_GWB1_31_29]KKP31209.1 MAG: hypothetical protein UR21_C0013G0003 [Candidatus Woesebacteria 